MFLWLDRCYLNWGQGVDLLSGSAMACRQWGRVVQLWHPGCKSGKGPYCLGNYSGSSNGVFPGEKFLRCLSGPGRVDADNMLRPSCPFQAFPSRRTFKAPHRLLAMWHQNSVSPDRCPLSKSTKVWRSAEHQSQGLQDCRLSVSPSKC